jgi:hypothetical protein
MGGDVWPWERSFVRFTRGRAIVGILRVAG